MTSGFSDNLQLLRRLSIILKNYGDRGRCYQLRPIRRRRITPSEIQLFRERLSGKMFTRQFRKVLWSIHCSWHCRTYFCCFPLALANICPLPPVPFFPISLKTVHLRHPTIPFGIVACTSRNSSIHNSSDVTKTEFNNCWIILVMWATELDKGLCNWFIVFQNNSYFKNKLLNMLASPMLSSSSIAYLLASLGDKGLFSLVFSK